MTTAALTYIDTPLKEERSSLDAMEGQDSWGLPRDLDQAWFWTESWQAGEAAVDAAYAAGDYRTFDDVEDFLGDLDSDTDE